MKSYLAPFLFTVASLIAISTHARAPIYFIPSEPTITAPADQASDVSITPEFASSGFSEKSISGLNPTLNNSNWIISEKDDNITIFSMESASDPYYSAPRLEYVIPFAISISGQTVTKLKFSTKDSKVELLNEADHVVAETEISLDEFDFPTDKRFVISKASSNSLLLQWHLVNDDSSEAILEFILVDGGIDIFETAQTDIFGWRMTPNEYTNTIFDSARSVASCKVAIDGDKSTAPSDYLGVTKDFTQWKLADAENYDKFFLACTSKSAAEEYALRLVELNLYDVISFSPKLKSFSFDTESRTLNDGQALSPATEYSAQVQHIGISGEATGASGWSEAITFTTRAALSNYQITAPTDLAFTTGQAKDLSFKISNTGTEAGAPQVTLRLPFEALKVTTGTFKVTVGEQNCALNQSGGKTDFVCQLDSLAAGDEVQLAAKITATDDTVKSIQYQVCDTASCDTDDFTTVNISVAPEASSSSSSSGGSMFWLFLMAPLLLVRRKK